MMGLRGSTLIGAALLVWVAWIVLATGHDERIERTCQPVLWVGNVFTSLVALTASDYQDTVEGAFESADYGCRYTVWRLVYEDDYLKAVEAEESANGGQR